RRQCNGLPSLVRWFTSLRRRPRCRSPCGETSSLKSPWSGRDRTAVVLTAPRHQHENDARDLVGERHRGQLELVFDRLALEHAARPPTQGVVMAFAVAKATPKNSRFGICDFTGIGCLADSRVRGERLYRDDDRRIIPARPVCCASAFAGRATP